MKGDAQSDVPAGDIPAGDAEGEILSVHFGHSANCSSIGSVVDVLFVSAAVGAATLSALGVLLLRKGGSPPDKAPDPPKGIEDPPRRESGDP